MTVVRLSRCAILQFQFPLPPFLPSSFHAFICTALDCRFSSSPLTWSLIPCRNKLKTLNRRAKPMRYSVASVASVAFSAHKHPDSCLSTMIFRHCFSMFCSQDVPRRTFAEQQHAPAPFFQQKNKYTKTYLPLISDRNLPPTYVSIV